MFAANFFRWELYRDDSDLAHQYIKGIEVALIELYKAGLIKKNNVIKKEEDIYRIIDELWNEHERNA